MLRDTSRFTGDHVCFTDIVEQRCFTVVDVSHDRNDRGTCLQHIFCFFFFLLDRFLNVHADKFNLESEFFCHDVDGFGVQALIDRYE